MQSQGITQYQRLNGFEIFFELERRIRDKEPTSLLRLGDGEGALMGFPDINNRKAIDRIFNVWFGHTDFADDIVINLSLQLKSAIKNADIVGIPRYKQMQLHPLFKSVIDTIDKHQLVGAETLITDAAIHRYLQFALLYRRLLANKDFVGVISSRDLSSQLKGMFSIQHIDYYPIRGEKNFPGEVVTPHYPDSFETIKNNLTVPYRGALFLVGAGALGKIYCDWIKLKGGIAIDIGSIFDAWSNVKSRLKNPCHSLERYTEFPSISMSQSISRYNTLLDELSLDSHRIDPSQYNQLLEETW